MRISLLVVVLAVACGHPPARHGNPPVREARTYTNPLIDDDFADPSVLRAADGWIAGDTPSGTPQPAPAIR